MKLFWSLPHTKNLTVLLLSCRFPFFFLQLRNKLNQEQSAKLQHQRENLNKRNLEMAAMDKRVAELRDRLWKKKAALQQKENLPVSNFPLFIGLFLFWQKCNVLSFCPVFAAALRKPDLSAHHPLPGCRCWAVYSDHPCPSGSSPTRDPGETCLPRRHNYCAQTSPKTNHRYACRLFIKKNM